MGITRNGASVAAGFCYCARLVLPNRVNSDKVRKSW
jgi:hypothetical protein